MLTRIIVVAQSTLPTTDPSGSTSPFSGLSCLICPLIIIGLIALLAFLSYRLNLFAVRKEAAAAYRGVHEEQMREQQEEKGPGK